jgi:hypothetical protein
MALLFFNQGISDEERVKLLKLYSELGGDIKTLERELMEKDKPQTMVHYTIKEPNPNAPMETTQEIGQLIRIPSKWRKRPG